MNRMNTLWGVLATLAILTTASTFGAHHEKGESATNPPGTPSTDARQARAAQVRAMRASTEACWIKSNTRQLGDWEFNGEWSNPQGVRTRFNGEMTLTQKSPGTFQAKGKNVSNGNEFENVWGVKDGKYAMNDNSFTVAHCIEFENGNFLIVQRWSNANGEFEWKAFFAADHVTNVNQFRPLSTEEHNEAPYAPFLTRWDTRVK